ncbi:hypothetical protein ACHRV5_15450 [Flavobacterium sp. FlaQc-52]|jgi:hypothetical protein|uniref:hypothetical protein n=1 Tax=Flavobacterium sp. FlaQc-52 TaxID=3374185 RepID=UPI0037572DA9
MKKSLLLLLLTHVFIINAQENKPNKNTLNTIIGQIDKRDLNCIAQIERAKKDFKSRETFYHISPEGYIDSNSNRHHPFLNELLKKKGIAFLDSDEEELSNFWRENDNQRFQLVTNCYCKASNELLNLKYGHNFTQKIQKTADSLYVISKLNDTFEYPYDVDDYCLIYPKAKEFLEQKNEIQKDFFALFKFPKHFIHSIDKPDFRAHTKFIIRRDDKISDIEIEIKFTNPENQKFSDYINSQLKNYIENADWKAATAAGVKVNSKFEMIFYN